MKMQGAIFDLDGTLLHSMPIWDTLAEDYLHSLGWEPRENLTERFRDFTLRQSAEYFIREYGVEQSVEEIIQGIQEMIAHFYVETAPLKAGVAEFLDELHRAGVRMCVATATDRVLAEAALRRNGIDRYIDFVLACGEGGYTKREAAVFEEALRRLGTEKAGTVVFEDAPHAAETAAEAGFPVCGVFDAAWGTDDCAALKRRSNWYIESFVALRLQTFSY